MSDRFSIDLTLPAPVKDNKGLDLKTLEDVIIELNALNRDYNESRKVLLDFMNQLNKIQYHIPSDAVSFEDIDPQVFNILQRDCNVARDMLENMNMRLK